MAPQDDAIYQHACSTSPPHVRSAGCYRLNSSYFPTSTLTSTSCPLEAAPPEEGGFLGAGLADADGLAETEVPPPPPVVMVTDWLCCWLISTLRPCRPGGAGRHKRSRALIARHAHIAQITRHQPDFCNIMVCMCMHGCMEQGAGSPTDDVRDELDALYTMGHQP